MSHPVKNYATKPPKHDLVSSRTAMQKALPHHLNNLCVTKTEFSDFLVYCVENNRNTILLFDLILDLRSEMRLKLGFVDCCEFSVYNLGEHG